VEALRLVGIACHRDPLLRNRHEEFLCLRSHFNNCAALQMERFGNSSGTNYKLVHATYSDAFFIPLTFRSQAILQ
jgi:hypothetical protein